MPLALSVSQKTSQGGRAFLPWAQPVLTAHPGWGHPFRTWVTLSDAHTFRQVGFKLDQRNTCYMTEAGKSIKYRTLAIESLQVSLVSRDCANIIELTLKVGDK